MTLSRRKWLTRAGMVVASAIYPCVIEPRWFEVSRHTVPLGLAKPLRVLHLSDLHASWAVPIQTIENAIDVGVQHKPDLICVTGDFITHGITVDPAPYIRVLRKLADRAPSFAVLGNHDGGSWSVQHRGAADTLGVRRLLQESGIRLLHNRSIEVSGIHLVGTGDLWSGEMAVERAFSTSSALPAVLLTHNPDGKVRASSHPWHLMLSGHTHGGQVIFPIYGPRYAPVKDKRYVAGLKPWSDRWIHVTRGVGNLGSVRFRCRPEVSILDLS